MTRVVCTICLMLIGGCIKTSELFDETTKDCNTAEPVNVPELVDEEIDEVNVTEGLLEPLPRNYGKGLDLSGTPQERLARLRKLEEEGRQQVIEVRKLRSQFLENIRVNEFIQFRGLNEKHIRTGPGMEYQSDDPGAFPEIEPFYVLEEKNGWIRFRVTMGDLGWSAWIQKDLTTPVQRKED